jgi:alanine dehydrogenase
MTELLVLSEDEVRSVLGVEELATALAEALTALSQDRASVPVRIAAFSEAGLLAAMPGHVPGLGMAAKLVSVFPHNAERQAPTHQALIAVFDDVTGSPSALIGGTYITAIRTAVTSALAARALARPVSTSVGVLGAGVQADAHLTALAQLLPVSAFRVASRNTTKASALADRHPSASAVTTAREAVDGADIVCCCTDAREAVVEDEWIAPGAHVTSVGSGAELPRALLERSRIFVESRTTASAPPPAGAAELQGWEPSLLTEIGEVLAGRGPGRASPEEVTLFKSTGHAVEDIAAAAVALRRARSLGLGTTVTLAP